MATESMGHAVRLTRDAIARGYDLIAACGGDGTLNEVIGGIGDSGVTLLPLPAGTANLLAEQAAIPREPDKAAALVSRSGLLRGAPRHGSLPESRTFRAAVSFAVRGGSGRQHHLQPQYQAQGRIWDRERTGWDRSTIFTASSSRFAFALTVKPTNVRSRCLARAVSMGDIWLSLPMRTPSGKSLMLPSSTASRRCAT